MTSPGWAATTAAARALEEPTSILRGEDNPSQGVDRGSSAKRRNVPQAAMEAGPSTASRVSRYTTTGRCRRTRYRVDGLLGDSCGDTVALLLSSGFRLPR